MNQPSYDVIISGAGPVGLFLACELALARCSVLILEKAEHPHSPLKKVPFGIRGLSAPTVEALYRRGLLDELTAPQRLTAPFGKPASARRQAGHFAGIPFHVEDIDTSQWPNRLPSSTATSLLSEMEELETVLALRAQALGVEIRRGQPATGFQQTGDGVAVQAGEQVFQGKWLVGCDGSRSVVRKAGGFEFAGTEPEFTGYSAQVDIADPEKLLPGRVMTPTGVYFQSQPGFLGMQEFDGGARHNGEAVTLEHLQQVLRRVSGTDVTINALHAASTWTDRARQATSYRNGRVLLAGDAAHIHAPLGGQGLNLGMGDAMNLGWKLAATIHGTAPAGLLDSYQAERHPIGVQVLDWSRAQVSVMRPTPNAHAMSAIIRELMNTRDGATYIAGRVWGVHMHYDLGGDHPLIGHSVPNFELEDGRRIGELMHAGQAMLLDFDAHASLRALAGRYGAGMRYVAGRAKEQLGLSALLIRPDGMVAWAAGQHPDPAAAERAATRFYSISTE
jgi:2-polyprenyl-6-methoxyphenol hydroxylase-like FAD-dependent oxidoreductase